MSFSDFSVCTQCSLNWALICCSRRRRSSSVGDAPHHSEILQARTSRTTPPLVATVAPQPPQEPEAKPAAEYIPAGAEDDDASDSFDDYDDDYNADYNAEDDLSLEWEVQEWRDRRRYH